MASLPANTGGNKRRVSYFYDGEAPTTEEATLLVAAFGPAEYLTEGAQIHCAGHEQRDLRLHRHVAAWPADIDCETRSKRAYRAKLNPHVVVERKPKRARCLRFQSPLRAL